MRVILKFFLIFLLGVWAAPLVAQSLFVDDFQDADAKGWQAGGKGDLRLTSYQNNISMRLKHGAFAVTIINIKKFENIRIAADFAAQSLEKGETCNLEASIDAKSWVTLGSIGDGQDDGLSLHLISADFTAANGRKQLALRISITGNSANDTCWVDNVKVSGDFPVSTLQKSLSAKTLIAGTRPVTPVNTKAFAQPAQTLGQLPKVQGVLSLSKDTKAGGFYLHKDRFDDVKASHYVREFPAFEISFISDGNNLIPEQRGPIASRHLIWEWIFQPGRIWQDDDETNWLRAAIPIALQERNSNCIHNGLMSFLIKPSGEISNAFVQIGSETCAYLQFDMWEMLPISFKSKSIGSAQELIHNFQIEQAQLLPRQAIGQLEQAFPNADPGQFGSNEEVSPQNLTNYGYVADGVLYSGPCPTRFGPDPFCSKLVLPSYSLAKSMVAGIGLMRLEALYPGAVSAKISDYVPECSSKKWEDVSFEQVLDMATGNFTSLVYDHDEAADKTWEFLLDDSHRGRISKACSVHKRQAKPGTKWVYHTTDTYILGTAMQAYLRQQSGILDADFYQQLLVPIWRELHLSPLAMQTRRSYDAIKQPFTGWGLSLLADDFAKIALFLQNQGRINGKIWLDQRLLVSALQRNPQDTGLMAINESLRYRAGFWAYNAGPAIGCTDDLWIPSMSGYGGLILALMPNGHVYFYVSDGHEYVWQNAAIASNQIQSFCKVQP